MIKFFLSVIVFLILTANFCLSQNVVSELNPKTKTYGFKNTKTKQWLAPPIYRDMRDVYSYENKIMKVHYFIAYDKKKAVLIAANGVTMVSPKYDDIKVIRGNPELFIVENGKDFSFFKPGKGVLKEPGIFQGYYGLGGIGEIYRVKKNGKFSLVNTGKDGMSIGEFDVVGERISDSLGGFTVKNNGKWGIADFSGKQVPEFIYDTIIFRAIYYSNNMMMVQKNKLWGLINDKGKTILECKYDGMNLRYLDYYTDSIANNFFPVKYKRKWGMMTLTEKINIPFEYDSIIGFRKNNLLCVVKNKKMGLIDMQNKIRYPFLFNEIEREDAENRDESKEKIYLVNNGNASYGVADSNGKIIQPLNANMVLLRTRYTFKVDSNFNKYVENSDSTVAGYLWNIGGKLQDEFKTADSVQIMNVDENGNEYVVTAVSSSSVITVKGGKSGILGRDGKIKVPVIYDDMIFNFTLIDGEGDARGAIASSISNSSTMPKNNKWEYEIDASVPIIAKKEGKFGLIAWDGKELTPIIYDSIFREYTSSSLDANDSVFAARNYPRYFYKVYKNGLHGYVSVKGKVLMLPEIEKDVCDITITSIDSIANPAYYPYHDHVTYTKILASNIKEKAYVICKQGYAYSPETGENESRPITVEFNYLEKAKFSFQNNNTVQFMAPSNAEDVILLDKYFTPYLLSSLRGQLILSDVVRGVIGFDSILDKASGKRVFKDMYIHGSEEELFFIDHMFAKYDGKWYLQNITGALLNKEQPFDSIEIVDAKKYKAWRQGKFIYYRFKYKGPFDREMDLEYPDKSFTERITCRDCKYKMKKYPRQTVLEQFDVEGNQIQDSIIHSTFDIPVMQNGMFNIIDSTNNPVLKIWTDEILLPPVNGYNFNMADSTSGIFDEKNLNKSGYPFCGTNKKSIALKYGQKWRLTTLKKQDKFIDGLIEVKIEGDNWAVKKKKKVLYYTIDGLKKVKK